MGMIVTLDRMIHANAVHQELGKEIGLGSCCCGCGDKATDLSPIDLVAMSVASCMIIVMAKGAEGKGLDLTGTWAETSYALKDYKIASIAVTVHCPYLPSAANREFLEKESHRCPVYLAVKDSVDVTVVFDWGTAAVPVAKKAAKACSAHCG